MLGLFTDDMRRNPFPLYAQLRQASPAFPVPGAEMWMLFDYAGVKRALTDTAAFSSAVRTPGGGQAPDWMIFNDAPRHTKLRALVLKAFTPRAIAALEPRIAEISLGLLKPAVATGEFDLIAEFAGPLPAIVIAEVLGIPAEDRARHLGWAETISKLTSVLEGGEAAQAAAAENAVVREEMRAYLDRALAERRRHPTDDVLSGLAHAEVDGQRLSDDDIFGFFQLLVFAGTEPTVNLIGNAVICLSETPQALAQLRVQPELIPRALEEVLRYRSPATFGFREARSDVEIGGRTLPKGALVLPVVASANRDPTVFRDPETFDIARDPNPHIAFGHGLHFCLGAALAKLEGRIALGQLLQLAPEIALASDEPWPPRAGLNIHGARSLRVRAEPSLAVV